MKLKCGMIIYKNTSNYKRFLLIKKKYTYTFINLILGKYNPYELNIDGKISNIEKYILYTYDIIYIYHEYFPNFNLSNKLRSKIIDLYNKFKNSIVDRYKIPYMKWLYNIKTCQTQWEMPKGAKYSYETDIECAIREVREETNIRANQLNIHYELHPLCISISPKYRIPMKICYFVAQFNSNHNIKLYGDKNEVSSIGWFQIHEIKHVRSHRDKKKALYICNEILTY